MYVHIDVHVQIHIYHLREPVLHDRFWIRGSNRLAPPLRPASCPHRSPLPGILRSTQLLRNCYMESVVCLYSLFTCIYAIGHVDCHWQIIAQSSMNRDERSRDPSAVTWESSKRPSLHPTHFSDFMLQHVTCRNFHHLSLLLFQLELSIARGLQLATAIAQR